MPGTGGPSPVDDPTVVSAYHAALGRQALVILAFVALLAIIWNVVRTLQFRRLAGSPASAGKSALVSEAATTAGSVHAEISNNGSTIGEVLPTGSSDWDRTGLVPVGRQELVASASEGVDALGVSSSAFTDSHLEGATWAKTQTIEVPIQYGSSQ